MAEIFLGYILSFVDFVYKLAVIAFTAKVFGWISGPQLVSTTAPPASSQDVGTTRSTQSKQAASNPLGEVFGNVLQQMGPLFQEALKPKDGKSKPTVNFSDDAEDTQAAQTVETQVVTPTEPSSASN